MLHIKKKIFRRIKCKLKVVVNLENKWLIIVVSIQIRVDYLFYLNLMNKTEIEVNLKLLMQNGIIIM